MKGDMTPQERGARMVRDSGYHPRDSRDIHTDAEADREEIAAAVHKHERRLHKGEKPTKLRGGGKVPGGESACRPDSRARGGRLHGAKTVIKIDASHKGDPEKEKMKEQEGMQMGAKLAAAKLGGAGGPPPGPPGAGPGGPPPPPMMPPGGAPPGMPPGGPAPGAMAPHPGLMPPAGGAPLPHMMPPPGGGGMHPPGMSTGGRMRDEATGRFVGGAL